MGISTQYLKLTGNKGIYDLTGLKKHSQNTEYRIGDKVSDYQGCICIKSHISITPYLNQFDGNWKRIGDERRFQIKDAPCLSTRTKGIFAKLPEITLIGDFTISFYINDYSDDLCDKGIAYLINGQLNGKRIELLAYDRIKKYFVISAPKQKQYILSDQISEQIRYKLFKTKEYIFVQVKRIGIKLSVFLDKIEITNKGSGEDGFIKHDWSGDFILQNIGKVFEAENALGVKGIHSLSILDNNVLEAFFPLQGNLKDVVRGLEGDLIEQKTILATNAFTGKKDSININRKIYEGKQEFRIKLKDSNSLNTRAIGTVAHIVPITLKNDFTVSFYLNCKTKLDDPIRYMATILDGYFISNKVEKTRGLISYDSNTKNIFEETLDGKVAASRVAPSILFETDQYLLVEIVRVDSKLMISIDDEKFLESQEDDWGGDYTIHSIGRLDEEQSGIAGIHSLIIIDHEKTISPDNEANQYNKIIKAVYPLLGDIQDKISLKEGSITKSFVTRVAQDPNVFSGPIDQVNKNAPICYKPKQAIKIEDLNTLSTREPRTVAYLTTDNKGISLLGDFTVSFYLNCLHLKDAPKYKFAELKNGLYETEVGDRVFTTIIDGLFKPSDQNTASKVRSLLSFDDQKQIFVIESAETALSKCIGSEAIKFNDEEYLFVQIQRKDEILEINIGDNKDVSFQSKDWKGEYTITSIGRNTVNELGVAGIHSLKILDQINGKDELVAFYSLQGDIINSIDKKKGELKKTVQNITKKQSSREVIADCKNDWLLNCYVKIDKLLRAERFYSNGEYLLGAIFIVKKKSILKNWTTVVGTEGCPTKGNITFYIYQSVFTKSHFYQEKEAYISAYHQDEEPKYTQIYYQEVQYDNNTAQSELSVTCEIDKEIVLDTNHAYIMGCELSNGIRFYGIDYSKERYIAPVNIMNSGLVFVKGVAGFKANFDRTSKLFPDYCSQNYCIKDRFVLDEMIDEVTCCDVTKSFESTEKEIQNTEIILSCDNLDDGSVLDMKQFFRLRHCSNIDGSCKDEIPEYDKALNVNGSCIYVEKELILKEWSTHCGSSYNPKLSSNDPMNNLNKEISFFIFESTIDLRDTFSYERGETPKGFKNKLGEIKNLDFKLVFKSMMQSFKLKASGDSQNYFICGEKGPRGFGSFDDYALVTCKLDKGLKLQPNRSYLMMWVSDDLYGHFTRVSSSFHYGMKNKDSLDHLGFSGFGDLTEKKDGLHFFNSDFVLQAGISGSFPCNKELEDPEIEKNLSDLFVSEYIFNIKDRFTFGRPLQKITQQKVSVSYNFPYSGSIDEANKGKDAHIFEEKQSYTLKDKPCLSTRAEGAFATIVPAILKEDFTVSFYITNNQIKRSKRRRYGTIISGKLNETELDFISYDNQKYQFFTEDIEHHKFYLEENVPKSFYNSNRYLFVRVNRFGETLSISLNNGKKTPFKGKYPGVYKLLTIGKSEVGQAGSLGIHCLKVESSSTVEAFYPLQGDVIDLISGDSGNAQCHKIKDKITQVVANDPFDGKTDKGEHDTDKMIVTSLKVTNAPCLSLKHADILVSIEPITLSGDFEISFFMNDIEQSDDGYAYIIDSDLLGEKGEIKLISLISFSRKDKCFYTSLPNGVQVRLSNKVDEKIYKTDEYLKIQIKREDQRLFIIIQDDDQTCSEMITSKPFGKPITISHIGRVKQNLMDEDLVGIAGIHSLTIIDVHKLIAFYPLMGDARNLITGKQGAITKSYNHIIETDTEISDDLFIGPIDKNNIDLITYRSSNHQTYSLKNEPCLSTREKETVVTLVPVILTSDFIISFYINDFDPVEDPNQKSATIITGKSNGIERDLISYNTLNRSFFTELPAGGITYLTKALSSDCFDDGSYLFVTLTRTSGKLSISVKDLDVAFNIDEKQSDWSDDYTILSVGKSGCDQSGIAGIHSLTIKEPVDAKELTRAFYPLQGDIKDLVTEKRGVVHTGNKLRSEIGFAGIQSQDCYPRNRGLYDLCLPNKSRYDPYLPLESVFATSELQKEFSPKFVLDLTSKPIDEAVNNSWRSKGSERERLYVKIAGFPCTIRGVKYINYHDQGGDTDIGVKSIKIYGVTKNAPPSASYDEVLEGYELLFNGKLIEHQNANIANWHALEFTSTNNRYNYLIFDCKDNYGNKGSLGLRSLQINHHHDYFWGDNKSAIGSAIQSNENILFENDGFRVRRNGNILLNEILNDKGEWSVVEKE